MAGLLKFYPMVVLIMAVRERAAIFVAIALAVTAALGGYVLSYRDEVVWIVRNFPTGFHYLPIVFGAKDLPGGLGVIMSKSR